MVDTFLDDLIEERDRLAKERDDAQARVEEYRKAERATSNAYLRLRGILDAWGTPPAPTEEQVWGHTESMARRIKTERDEAVARVMNLEEFVVQVLKREVSADGLRCVARVLDNTSLPQSLAEHDAALLERMAELYPDGAPVWNLTERAARIRKEAK